MKKTLVVDVALKDRCLHVGSTNDGKCELLIQMRQSKLPLSTVPAGMRFGQRSVQNQRSSEYGRLFGGKHPRRIRCRLQFELRRFHGDNPNQMVATNK